MPVYGIREASLVLGVSDDTVRRWGESGKLILVEQPNGHRGVDGRELARAATTLADMQAPVSAGRSSARNRLHGIVTGLVLDSVMAQVEVQCGPYRVSSLISREAAEELALEPGVLVIASIKATNVVVELPVDTA